MFGWPRMLALAAGATVAGLTLCSCSETWPEPVAETTLPGVIEGYLRDLETPGNDPVRGATVFAVPGQAVTSSDAAGYYRLPGLLPGYYHVTAVTKEPRSAAGDCLVRSSQTTVLNIDFGTPPPSILNELIFLSDRVLVGSPFAYLSNSRGETPLRFMPELLIALSFIRWNPSDREEVLYAGVGANNQLYRYDTRARVSTPITFDAQDKMGADWSPDGTRVVFSGDLDANGSYELILMNRDGTGQVTLVDDYEPLTGQSFDNRWPSWSPDGYTIAFSARRTDLGAPIHQQDYELCTTQVTGGPIYQLTDDLVADTFPAWHPDSTQLLWSKAYNTHYQLYLMVSSVGATQHRLTNELFDNVSPSFSWDGRQIAWVSSASFDGTNTNNSPEVHVAEFAAGPSLSNPRALTNFATPTVHASVEFRPR